MATREELAEKFFEQVVNARKEFDTTDGDINNSIKKTLEAFAGLAEQKPEELFGLKPTERDKFFANKLLDPKVLRAATFGTDIDEEFSENDITGSQTQERLDLAKATPWGALAEVLSSESGAKIVEEILSHTREEKSFFIENGKDFWGYVKGLFTDDK